MSSRGPLEIVLLDVEAALKSDVVALALAVDASACDESDGYGAAGSCSGQLKGSAGPRSPGAR